MSIRTKILKMATATHFQLRNDATARFRVPDISTQTAAKASELLQKNHESHDLIFNDDGLHSESADAFIKPNTVTLKVEYGVLIILHITLPTTCSLLLLWEQNPAFYRADMIRTRRTSEAHGI